MSALKLTAIGTSTGVMTPKEMLDRLKVGEGDMFMPSRRWKAIFDAHRSGHCGRDQVRRALHEAILRFLQSLNEMTAEPHWTGKREP